MLIPLAWKDQLFQLLTEIPVIVKYPHNTVLDNVCHKRYFDFEFDFLLLSSEKQEMLHHWSIKIANRPLFTSLTGQMKNNRKKIRYGNDNAWHSNYFYVWRSVQW